MTRTTLRRTTSAARARLFFAVYPDDDARERIAQVQAGFAAGRGTRATPPNNFHLTLAFLGETATEARECYAQAAGGVEIPTFDVVLDRFHYFSKRSMCWLAPTTTPVELRTLHKRLQRALAPCGYRDRREFRPHVTLFRKAAGLSAPGEPPAIEWRVDRFFLVESAPKDGGVVYVPIEEYR